MRAAIIRAVGISPTMAAIRAAAKLELMPMAVPRRAAVRDAASATVPSAAAKVARLTASGRVRASRTSPTAMAVRPGMTSRASAESAFCNVRYPLGAMTPAVRRGKMAAEREAREPRWQKKS
jgi:hypothetical protein